MPKQGAATRSNASGEDTRARLISAAVRHFAKDGYAAASQRAIQRDAGVNAAAAHYHFGSKAALYRAVIDTFIHDVQKQRIERHAALPKKLAGKERLEKLLYNYFWPGIAIAADPEGYHYSLILSRVQGELQDEGADMVLDAVRPVRNLYLDSLSELFPDTDRSELESALTAGVSLMATTPRRFPPDFNSATAYADRHAARLARFCSAGMAALLGEPRSDSKS